MYLWMASMLVLAAGAILSLIPLPGGLGGKPGRILAVTGSTLAFLSGLGSLLSGVEWNLSRTWSIPMGSLHLGMDALSAFFTIPIGLVSLFAAVYGGGYLETEHRRRVSASWFFFNFLVLSMLLVVCARNGLLFLISWEVMSLSSFFLVMFHREREEIVRAGFTYLVASHLGTALLLAVFLLLDRGGMEFSLFSPSAGTASVIFLLSIVGFGTKAGLVPVHVWLPEAHPAAPSHVSALMSGVMIKMGIYGMLRILTYLGHPLPWWGWLLLIAGVTSGILGVLFALAQHNLKRLLAYHSVENIGIIALGLGLGTLGLSYGSTVIAVLGFAGGLLHVVNHAIFKSLLFMGAGTVYRAAGTLEIDQLGGLLRPMPITGAAFLTGSAAISGIPPLNGFVSEFLIFSAGLTAVVTGGPLFPAGVLTVAGLALIGGLAVACFTKAFGIVFLGEPRTAHGCQAADPGPVMSIPMGLLAVFCVVLGLGAPWLFPFTAPAVAVLTHHPGAPVLPAKTASALTGLATAGGGLIALTLVLYLTRKLLQRGRSVVRSRTWSCGYLAPTPRMQYTASSFAQPVVGMFRMFLRPRREVREPDGLLPAASAALATHTPDIFRERFYDPFFRAVRRGASLLRWLHQGQTHYYVLYIALTVLALLAWRF